MSNTKKTPLDNTKDTFANPKTPEDNSKLKGCFLSPDRIARGLDLILDQTDPVRFDSNKVFWLAEPFPAAA